MKAQLRHLLEKADFQSITRLAGQHPRVLSFLTALTYDHDPQISWRAVEAIGLAAARVADNDPERVRIHLRRMQWLLNDESGGIGWRLPEAMGEIIRNRPDRFREFVPIVISLFDMEEEDVVRFRPGILWAVGRLGQVIPQDVRPAIPWIVPCLNDPNPQTRGMAVWCLGQFRAVEHLAPAAALLEDNRPVQFYSGGQLTRTTVANLARAALAAQ